ncbi:prostate and testis expressed protein 4 [Rattus rattus]|uniref:prostate and testis expressed protein 4 n=1 Tax=Rattus rattus TaxID=10117 RepID=UPI0013F38D0A|nr:prostate and testis expressed protein 4 [Rattus rattus]
MNSMTKISILLIVALSFLCFTEANTNLICNTCNRSENSECKYGTGQCTAPEGGSCSTISVYHGQRHVLSKQMCLGHCEEKPHYDGDYMIYVMCCSKNLCNSF